jgi:hypothetical protein
VPQLMGQPGRLKGPVTADVDPSQQDHERHGCPLDDTAGTARASVPSCCLNAEITGALILRVRWNDVLAAIYPGVPHG